MPLHVGFISMQDIQSCAWLPFCVYTYIRLGTALFPTKINLWFIILVLHLGLVKGKAWKNLSDCPPLGRCVTLLGKVAENYSLYGITLLMLIRSVTPCRSSIVSVPFTCVWATLYGPLVRGPNLVGLYRFFNTLSLVDGIIMPATFLIFTHKVLINQVFSSLSDGVPVGN